MQIDLYKVKTHPFSIALCNFALVMAIYSLSRLFFFYINRDFFPDVTDDHLLEMLRGGLRFDLTALLYLNCVYIGLCLLPLPINWKSTRGYIRTARFFYLVPNALGILVNCMDMVYFRFTFRRTTCTVFSEFDNESNLFSILFHGIFEYWYVTLFGLLMLRILRRCSRHLVAHKIDPYRPTNRVFLIPKRFVNFRADRPRPSFNAYYLRETVILCLTFFFLVIGIRGGFGKYTRPITISNATQYTNRPAETAVVLNTPFTLMMSSVVTPYVNPQYFPDDVLETIMSPIHTPSPNNPSPNNPSPNTPKPQTQTSKPTSPNLCILILESFSQEHIGFYNHHLDGGTYQGYTPFLDSLLAQSITFQHSYASGRKSIDAMPSILSSIPMLIEPFIVTPYSTNAISSIADILSAPTGVPALSAPTGVPASSSFASNLPPYTTAFFHGAPNGSMGFQAYARSARFAQYYGKDEFEDAHPNADAFDGTWAIWDEEFLQFYAETMSTMTEPFCTSVFTASSHHPFRVPDQYKDLPEGPQPLCKCITYSDHALQQFFQTASQQPWFQNTLFVITADHTNQPYHDEYLTDEGLFRVPIAFYAPWLTPQYDTTTVISQVDILPSVLTLLGNQQPYFAFGESVFPTSPTSPTNASTHYAPAGRSAHFVPAPKPHNYAINYHHPYYQIISRNGMIQFDGETVVSASSTLSPEEKDDMLAYLKATIQQYIARMINDRLTL